MGILVQCWNVNWCSHYEKVGRFLKKIKNRTTIQSGNLILGTDLKKTKIFKKIHDSLFVISDIQKQPKCPRNR